ncbi:hypothetical protein ACH5RR_018659 [Cinchona calisaya]|uniref:TATA box-binding protein-associated factor RNA polymerase I subunit B n=1 Tax=Cinchona calisaya TaxID=153742 RepID=A0ABD2ZQ80_9GENT
MTRVEWTCHVCGNVSFKDGGDGSYYYNRCSSQADDIIETGVDEDDFVASQNLHPEQHSFPAHQMPLQQRAFLKLNKRNPSTGTCLKTWKRVVILIQEMDLGLLGIVILCKVLVEKFNASPLVVGLVGPIWLRYLAFTRIMPDDWADESLKCGTMRLLVDLLVGAREAILPTDILKWTLEGKLPCFAAFVEIGKQLGPPSSACLISSSFMFRPTKTISLQRLEALAASVAWEIGLNLPPVNFYDDEEFESDAVDLLKILENKYDNLKDTNDLVFAGSGPSLEDHKEEKIIEDLWEFYQNKDVERLEDQAHHKNNPSDDGTQYSMDENHYSSRCEHSSNEGQSSMKSHRDEAIRKLKLDMEENRFSYIPPRRQIKNLEYILYARKKKEGAYVYAAHANYYILLRACTKVAQVDLRSLHAGVLNFESRLKQLEEKIDKVLEIESTQQQF